MLKKKILIVDDEPGITHMVKLALEQTGHYEVFEENKSTRGVESARVYSPDLVILDVTMPDVTGLQVAQMMRADNLLKDLPIIFLTATATREESHGEGWRENVIYIRKPATLPELINGIEQSIEAAQFEKKEDAGWVAGSQ